MTKAAKSLFIFGIYAVLTGLAFVAVPETLISTLHLPAISSGWARAIGLLVLVIGTYDIVSARAESMPLIRASVFVRLGFAVGITLLVIVGQMPISTMPLGAIDAAGAIWTAFALKSR